MNAPVQFSGLDSTAPAGKSATPADLDIVVRDRRFGRGREQRRHWMDGDPVATAWFTALSATFPRGEAYFIESVKAFRDGAPPKLAAEIRAFVRQEINHTREHIAFNKMAEAAGYEIGFVDDNVKASLDLIAGRPEILNLASTMALEHFTAMLGRELLENPQHLDGADADFADLWRWHSIEEVEHKGVAFDTWLHATRDWSDWKRYKVRCLMMIVVTRNFLKNRVTEVTELLRQDGITGWTAKRGIARYLLGKPGFLRKILPEWLSFFRPGFHPWDHDNRALIQRYESDFADAVMPAA